MPTDNVRPLASPQATTTTTEAITTTTASTTTTTGATTTTRDSLHYDETELAYFGDIAGQVEYGDEGGLVHKWTEDLRIAVYGDPTRRDLAALDNVIQDINELIAPLRLTLVENDPNLEIHFAPETGLAAILPEYVPGNLGFVYVWWDGDGAITQGAILISTTGVTPDERAHLIREELTQSLGLLADSLEYEDSIFQMDWTTANRYAPIDRAVIEMLYRPELVPGMTIADALALLELVVRD